jgi:hypothetical protein
MAETKKTSKRGKIASEPELLGNLLSGYQLDDKGGYITQEFQDYGYRLACEMGEEKKKGMYIRLAKTVDRGILERARSFVLDAERVDNKGKLFMWAVGKLKRGEALGGELTTKT